MKRFRKLLHLSAAEQRLLVEATLLLGAIRLGLWLLPFRTLRRLLAKLMKPPTGSRRETARYSLETVVWAVEVVSHYMPGAKTCLTRALAVQVLLARRGYPALLHIGVLRGEGRRLQAHAWLESEGRVVIGGSELGCYTPLVTLEEESHKRYYRGTAFS